MGQHHNGVLISMDTGKALAYSLDNLQERGRLMIGHGDEVYEGLIIGIHSRDNDLVVNPLKGKKLTNMRASGTDENVVLTPPIRMTLEQALEFIDDDELVVKTKSCLISDDEKYPASAGYFFNKSINIMAYSFYNAIQVIQSLRYARSTITTL
jgi:predicted membrane GTPase involved in stress response